MYINICLIACFFANYFWKKYANMIFRLSVYIGHCKGQRPMQPGPNTRVGERVKGREGGRERGRGWKGEEGKEGGRERERSRKRGREWKGENGIGMEREDGRGREGERGRGWTSMKGVLLSSSVYMNIYQ